MKNEGRHEESVFIRHLFVLKFIKYLPAPVVICLEIRDTKMNIIVVYCHNQWFSNFYLPRITLSSLVKMRFLGFTPRCLRNSD